MNLAIYPVLLFILSFFGFALSAWLGARYRTRHRTPERVAQEHFGLVVGATLTLLGLIIGFTFSMALTRYDLRKNYEEAEANAIGTEFVRADLLPAADAAKVRELLLRYVDQRILWYTVHDAQRLRQINAEIAKLQAGLWSAVLPQAMAQPTPITALTVSGMNDVLNSQGYTQAAWWNRIPPAAWSLMAALAVCANALVGFAVGKSNAIWILPLVIAIAFFLMADIDAPRRGIIKVVPQNLMSLSDSLHAQSSSPAR